MSTNEIFRYLKQRSHVLIAHSKLKLGEKIYAWDYELKNYVKAYMNYESMLYIYRSGGELLAWLN